MRIVRRAVISTLVLFSLCLIGVGLLFAPLAGCRRPAEREAEKRILALLPRYIGPADKYTAKVTGDSPGAVLRGRLRQVHVEGKGVRLTRDLRVDELVMDFDEVSVDPKAGRLQNVGRAAFNGRISDVSLNRYLRATRNIPELNLEIGEGALTVSAKPELLNVVSVPISVRGQLVPRGKSLLEFVPDRAQISIVPIPGIALEWLTARLNPTLDISLANAPLQISSVQVRDHSLYITGSIAPDDILNIANP